MHVSLFVCVHISLSLSLSLPLSPCVCVCPALYVHMPIPCTLPQESSEAHFEEVSKRHSGVGEAVDEGRLQETLCVVQGPHEGCHAAETGGNGTSEGVG